VVLVKSMFYLFAVSNGKGGVTRISTLKEKGLFSSYLRWSSGRYFVFLYGRGGRFLISFRADNEGKANPQFLSLLVGWRFAMGGGL